MKYDDIIDLPHYEPKNHPRMSIEGRSSIFAPFSALAGYHEEIIEASRDVSMQHELSEDEESILNQQLFFLNGHIKEKKMVTITYFVRDLKKSGGVYLTKQGIVERIDLVNRFLRFQDKEKINLDDILSVNFNNV